VDSELDFEKRYRLVREIIETIVLTVLMFLIIRLAVQNFNIDGVSMEPGLHDKELILVDKWSYLFHQPARGDVIVFTAPPVPTQDYIKRIIGLPGDVITIQNTTVFVNGKQLKEVYVDERHQGNPYPPVMNRVVPPDAYFVLGDNRGGSSDSRDWGCVPKKNVIGRAALVYWPLGQDNNGLLPSHASVFKDVPASPKNVTTSVCPVMTSPRVPPQGAATPQNSAFDVNGMLIIILPGIYWGYPRKRR
jgi:signal peptidase I